MLERIAGGLKYNVPSRKVIHEEITVETTVATASLLSGNQPIDRSEWITKTSNTESSVVTNAAMLDIAA